MAYTQMPRSLPNCAKQVMLLVWLGIFSQEEVPRPLCLLWTSRRHIQTVLDQICISQRYTLPLKSCCSLLRRCLKRWLYAPHRCCSLRLEGCPSQQTVAETSGDDSMATTES